MKHSKKFITAMVIVGILAGTEYIVQAKFSESDNAEAVMQAKVSMINAIEIALLQVPGNAIGAEFESDDGKILWEIEILATNKKVYELEIDATSGKVVNQKEDEDDEEGEDDKDDEKGDRD